MLIPENGAIVKGLRQPVCSIPREPRNTLSRITPSFGTYLEPFTLYWQPSCLNHSLTTLGKIMYIFDLSPKNLYNDYFSTLSECVFVIHKTCGLIIQEPPKLHQINYERKKNKGTLDSLGFRINSYVKTICCTFPIIFIS